MVFLLDTPNKSQLSFMIIFSIPLFDFFFAKNGVFQIFSGGVSGGLVSFVSHRVQKKRKINFCGFSAVCYSSAWHQIQPFSTTINTNPTALSNI